MDKEDKTTFKPFFPRIKSAIKQHGMEVAHIIIVGIFALLYWQSIVALPFLFGAIAFGLYPLVKAGLIKLFKERRIGTEIFITIATIVAIIGKEYTAAAVLLTIILIAELIADWNTNRARVSIQALIGSVPEVALIRGETGDYTIPVKQIKVGDIVLARSGEKIPVDGIIISGTGSVNEATITGESLPVEKEKGSSVLAGTIVDSGAFDIRTEKVGQGTLFARIINLVENAEEHQARVEKLADRVAAWLIPAVFIFLLVVYLITRDLHKIVTLLIFTSPAELALATPLVVISAVARAAHSGILVKGGLYLESLAKADVILFDKTGTLTIGQPQVAKVYPMDSKYTENDILILAASADQRSSHPLAKAIVAYAKEKKLKFIEPTEFKSIQGRGVWATLKNQTLLAGNAALLTESKISLPDIKIEELGTIIYVALNNQAIGAIALADQIRPGARGALAKLKETGVKKLVMLTGDSKAVAEKVGNQLGIDVVKAELYPEDKVNAVADYERNKQVVVMVGDGVNDAPALARATVGIAMGARGTQAALEAADIALMTDDLEKIVLARSIAKRAYRTIKENLIFGVGVVHVLGIIAALLGWIGPIQAAMIHLVPDVLVFVNSVKLLKIKI
ncbi:MAG: heavy metal translocating P-type ATPase [Candidatus Humimicrobiaceae bacterium]